ncbi:MAG: hypothetical protein GEU77_09385 [Deltaproteobacteria bacterium]|nr:hypothetical protein [Deltaproteobacteria bacterium]
MAMIRNLFSSDDTGSLFEPDAVLASQFYANFKRSPSKEPELMLMAAVLEDAVSCLSIKMRRATARQRKQIEDARHWLAAEDENDWIFSFKNICDAMGINPNYLRRGLMQWSGTPDASSVRGPRSTSIRFSRRHKKLRLRTSS